jgi:hypothetical protein
LTGGRCVFDDRSLERAFLDNYFCTVRTSIHVAHAIGIAMWILWGLVVRHFLIDQPTFDVLIRYLVLVPILAITGQRSDISPSDLTSINKRTY